MWTEKNKGIEWREILMLRIDHYTRMTAFFFLRKNLEAFKHLKIYKDMVENKMDFKIKCLILDNGGEFE